MGKMNKPLYPKNNSTWGERTHVGYISKNVQHRDDPHGGGESNAQGVFGVFNLGEDRIYIIIPLIREYRIQESRPDFISIVRGALKGCLHVEVVRVRDASMASQSGKTRTHDEQ